MGIKTALLYLSYGTPRSEADLLPYMTSIRRGHQPSHSELEEVAKRYQEIGCFREGLSPLNQITTQQGQALVARLNQGRKESSWCLYQGYQHMSPTIEEALEAICEEGVDRVVVLLAAPFSSVLGTRAYVERVKTKAKGLGISPIIVENWWKEETFSQYWVSALVSCFKGEVFSNLGQEAFMGVNQDKAALTQSVQLILSAHSLPALAKSMGDSYMDSLAQCGQGIITRLEARLGLEVGQLSWSLAWQSAARRGEWLSPRVEDVIDRALAGGRRHIVIVPIGFISNHLEVLYDNDVLHKNYIEIGGGCYYRPPMPNEAPLLIEAMASAVEAVKG